MPAVMCTDSIVSSVAGAVRRAAERVERLAERQHQVERIVAARG
jgi:hypothetical protein